MSSDDFVDSREEFEKALQSADKQRYVLRLYVCGMTARSVKAVEDVRRVCDETLSGRCELQVVDIREHPEAAKEAQVIAAPTLVKELPLPLRKLIGDMSKAKNLFVGLNVASKSKDP